jgi:hypothetical protein
MLLNYLMILIINPVLFVTHTIPLYYLRFIYLFMVINIIIICYYYIIIFMLFIIMYLLIIHI